MKMGDEPKSNHRPEPDIPPGFADPPVVTEDGEINLGTVRTLMSKSGLRDADLWAHLEVSAWQEITGDKLVEAINWIEKNIP